MQLHLEPKAVPPVLLLVWNPSCKGHLRLFSFQRSDEALEIYGDLYRSMWIWRFRNQEGSMCIRRGSVIPVVVLTDRPFTHSSLEHNISSLITNKES